MDRLRNVFMSHKTTCPVLPAAKTSPCGANAAAAELLAVGSGMILRRLTSVRSFFWVRTSQTTIVPSLSQAIRNRPSREKSNPVASWESPPNVANRRPVPMPHRAMSPPPPNPSAAANVRRSGEYARHSGWKLSPALRIAARANANARPSIVTANTICAKLNRRPRR